MTDRIDVHHHLIPPAWREEAERVGLSTVAGAPLPDWSPEASLAVMDANGIGTAILSLSAPGIHLGDRARARDVARASNEYAADLRVRHPGRFGSFAVLPMPNAEDSAREAEYALDTLGADGVVLLGSTDGVFLGDPRLDELMAELDRRDAVVFVHPNLHATSEALGLDLPGFFVEFLCDTTRAAANLIFSGRLHRYPRIRFILAHAGGFLPYITWRLSLANEIPALAAKVPGGVLAAVRSFYFDTALSPAPWVLRLLKDLVGIDHVLFGSDFPFAPAIAVGMECKTLTTADAIDASDRAAIDRANAVALFGGDRWSGQAGPPHGVADRLRRAAQGPIVAVADRLRDR
ncbi:MULTISPECIES: amidohydrolase family protein [unclassified Sphingomonas]|uniref:amidohydrolase family protein n=1 Tax=unclassified Sphingomonas TaxID=196159 RepID=UPI000925CA03|nr:MULTISPECIES: amidohydrolase family protein [unclassified Sphingomonas]MBN8847962.1 amidohydrolase [Sphingomonas sp.]OJV34200.1 MAG: amidohydrolase [Sphingomonas sp. 67-36]